MRKRPSVPESSDPFEGVDIRVVDINLIEANCYNANEFEPEMFEVLVSAIREEGMVQPLLVREHPDAEGRYIIVDGEHRWNAARVAGIEKVVVVVMPYDEMKSKIRTLSMNAVRGANVPVKLARIIVDLQKEYSAREIAAMTGIPQDEQKTSLKLLSVPNFKATDGVRLKRTQIEKSEMIHLSIALSKSEHDHYTMAMKKAMRMFGDDVTVLVGDEITEYDQAMGTAYGIAGAKMRNVALAAICFAFNELDQEVQARAVAFIREKIADNRASDAAARVQQKTTTDKKVTESVRIRKKLGG